MNITSPLSLVRPRKTKPPKLYYLNLNGYRNWHFQISNDLKRIYCEGLEKELKGKILPTPIDITFTLYKKTKRKTDRSNILSIIEKFFCDALVEHGCIPDDNDEYIRETHYKTGGIDGENPRVEILINQGDG